MGRRYIKLYEQITSWEWFHTPSTLALFIYLLLKANYKDSVVHGVPVKRGQLLTSLPKLSTDVGLSIQQTRTAISHLKSTGEITDVSNRQHRVITIVKYDEYQGPTDAATEDQQTINRRSNRQSTDGATPYIEYIEYKNNTSLPPEESIRTKKFTPPTIDDIKAYCEEKGIFGFDAQKFVDYYTSNGWMVGRNKMKDWKAAMRTWVRTESQRNREKKRDTELDLPY